MVDSASACGHRLKLGASWRVDSYSRIRVSYNQRWDFLLEFVEGLSGKMLQNLADCRATEAEGGGSGR